ncbi:alpha-hydroxy-acid oxidizing enzyme [Streptomyces inusitatus]|uniref:Alpha-hydroxy-acid oxidizing enzyme n=1 Tax=Streptomyces inusitatus TaxID=68221 RepID=A0A918UK20_9ACTN|nr:alpha-hydroxy acid oxidase [Streptomyces inusitatus]GGZ16150.1 alpha-hydroxy-acid oxidizing enzyme [Streptomyces inusitatus]
MATAQLRPDAADGLERAARAVLPSSVADFIGGGAGEELTLAWEQQAFTDYALRPRVLSGVDRPDLSVSMLGCAVSLPMAVAPMAYQRLVHPAGELEAVEAAGRAGALTVVPMLSSVGLEEVADAAAGPLWFQLYCLRDREVVADLARRAERAGYRALVLTADAPRLGSRRRDLRNGFTLPPGVTPVNLPHRIGGVPGAPGTGASAIAQHAAATHDATFSWSDLAWLRAQTELPLVVKGVLCAEDAVRAADTGADGIIVSSHGGRQLDRAVPSLHALPEVAEAVGDRCEVYLDGGVRRGTDILVAAALGARAVFAGRPVLWALAAGGADAVAELFAQVRGELQEAMVLAGRSSLAGLDGLLSPRRRERTC